MSEDESVYLRVLLFERNFIWDVSEKTKIKFGTRAKNNESLICVIHLNGVVLQASTKLNEKITRAAAQRKNNESDLLPE